MRIAVRRGYELPTGYCNARKRGDYMHSRFVFLIGMGFLYVLLCTGDKDSSWVLFFNVIWLMRVKVYSLVQKMQEHM